MLNPVTSLRALGAVTALSAAIGIGSAFAIDEETYWYAAGEPSLPNGQLWVTSYGECWQSMGGPRNLPPCEDDVIPVEVTIAINFEFDEYRVPDNVVNMSAVREIDDYIDRITKTPENEFVTVVGHTDAKGSDEYNMALGMRRAEAVRDYIIRQGYPAEHLGQPVSMGKRDLIPGVDPFSVEQRRVVLTKTN